MISVNVNNQFFFLEKINTPLVYKALATILVLCFNLVLCNSQNNTMICNTVPDHIEDSHFERAKKSDFIYVGETGKRTLFSDLIKSKCIPPNSSKKIFLVFAGDLVIDTKYDFKKGTEIIALNSAQIIVESDVSFSDSYLHSCEKSWLGMNIKKGKATLDMDKKTKIEDTDRAIGIDLSE